MPLGLLDPSMMWYWYPYTSYIVSHSTLYTSCTGAPLVQSHWLLLQFSPFSTLVTSTTTHNDSFTAKLHEQDEIFIINSRNGPSMSQRRERLAQILVHNGPVTNQLLVDPTRGHFLTRVRSSLSLDEVLLIAYDEEDARSARTLTFLLCPSTSRLVLPQDNINRSA